MQREKTIIINLQIKGDDKMLENLDNTMIKIIKDQRAYETMQKTISLSKSTIYAIEDLSREKNIEFNLLIELMLNDAMVTK